MKDLPFAMVPVELALDKRLSAYDFRVMVALFSFLSRTGGAVEPSIYQLSDRCGCAPRLVEYCLDTLRDYGWIDPESLSILIPNSEDFVQAVLKAQRAME